MIPLERGADWIFIFTAEAQRAKRRCLFAGPGDPLDAA
jgi:hypothetical protein